MPRLLGWSAARLVACPGDPRPLVLDGRRHGTGGAPAHPGPCLESQALDGLVNKTDKLDAKGWATVLRNGTVPAVWIAPGPLRDPRELPRLRMTFVRVRTALKHRIPAAFAQYGLALTGASALFGATGRRQLEDRWGQLPPETQRAVRDALALLDPLHDPIEALAVRIREVVRETPLMEPLETLPGVGPILAIVIALVLGTIERFPTAEHFASYSGTVPRVVEAGGTAATGGRCART